MSYQEIHELYVICDECHTSLFVDDATDEDADNEAADHGWQCGELQGRHYCPLEYEGWQVNSTDPNDSLCPECAKTRKETK